MYKKIASLVFLLILFDHTNAQIFPAEGSTLNYRLIGFSFPGGKQQINYKVEIASGSHTSYSSFKKNIIKTVYCRKSKAIITVPAFGAQYTWRAVYPDKPGKTENNTVLNHFSTSAIPATDTSKYRLRIIKPAEKYKDAFVFVDATGVLYDMNGQPIWYLPNIDKSTGNEQLRDLKSTPFGTITFIKGSRIYEISYDGKVLWAKPDTGHEDKKLDTINNLFHHEFTRLANGHYMVMGSETMLCKLPGKNDSSFFIVPDGRITGDSRLYSKIPFGTITEFDENGNTAWTWSTWKYVMASDLIYNQSHNSVTDLHDNSFFFDEKNKTVYISFKGVSRVIKIKYPAGNVVYTYGVIYDHTSNLKDQMDIQENRYAFFCGQHACRRSREGYLYVFNNGCDLNAPSHITKLTEPSGQNDTLNKVWDYLCDTDDLGQTLSLQPNSGGGNVEEMPDGSIFAAMGHQCNKVFIVNKRKEITWSAISEMRDPVANSWKIIPSYRSSIVVSYKEIEKMIWNSEKQ